MSIRGIILVTSLKAGTTIEISNRLLIASTADPASGLMKPVDRWAVKR